MRKLLAKQMKAIARPKYSSWDASRFIRGQLGTQLGIKRTGSAERRSKISFYTMTSNGLWFALIGDPEGGVADKGGQQTRLLFEVEPPQFDGIRREPSSWRGHSIRSTRLENHFSCYAESESALRAVLEWYGTLSPKTSSPGVATAKEKPDGPLSYTYSDIEPVISRICEELGQGRFARHDEIVEALLIDSEGKVLVANARALGNFSSDRSAAASMLALYAKHSERVEDRLERAIVDGQTAYRVRAGRIESDIEALLADPGAADTERSQQILARIGQGLFRRKVIQTWKLGERCAVTGCEVRQMLVASHIVPWSEDASIRLEGTNGILLCAHIDRLFDARLISFDVEARILFSAKLSGRDRKWLSQIGVNEEARLDMQKLSPGAKERVHSCLERHRTKMM